MPRRGYETISENHKALQFEKMYKSASKFLDPLGIMPDKASLDYGQVLKLHLELQNTGNIFRDAIQKLILQKEVAKSLLQNMAN
ncbi:MAG: hypothetical protein KGI28_00450 [Thaumarchaeota archaeon]|nr:hypothetical protein [Nitrososphaerota archaeon]